MRHSLVLDRLFTRHQTPPGHPERADRIRSILRRLEGWEGATRFSRILPLPAEDVWIRAVHADEHFRRVEATAGNGMVSLDPDTQVGPHSFETALLAVGGTVDLTVRVLQGESESGMVLIRPPGHHAERERIMGFCLFNNVAVAAERAIRHLGAGRVAIVDFDVHHGNGTQQIFFERADALFVSLHQHPCYPGTGSFKEVGEGKGRGYTLNFPIAPGMGDAFYRDLLSEMVVPVLRRFRPELILVSAGYDAHMLDPLASMNLSTAGFGEICFRLNAVAKEVCEGRIVYVLEGGYHLDALCESVVVTLETLVGTPRTEVGPGDRGAFEAYRARVRRAYSGLWHF